MRWRLDSREADFDTQLYQLVQARRGAETDVRDIVADILTDVRCDGDEALLELTARLDNFTCQSIDQLRFTDTDLQAAMLSCPADELEALKFAADRIEAFHRTQCPQDEKWQDEAGVTLGTRWRALEAVGVYVPGGRAAYPSSVLMNIIPAKVAGVERIVMVVPTPNGDINPLVLAAAKLAGADEVWRLGGAQAVAALAYGTDSIAPVDKIVGPGNAYVAEAKRQVFGRVGIDMIAGPSEILVVADDQNDPRWIAADLMSQAEHDPEAQAILITDSEAFADQVSFHISELLTALPKEEIAGASWRRHGAMILVEDLYQQAPAVINQLASEHLELAVAEPEKLAEDVRHAGAIFLGRHTPEAIGDYIAGPNHVLPTDRTARFSSGLNVLDFMKRSTLVGCDQASIGVIGPAAVTLAKSETLHAHALSVGLRLGQEAADILPQQQVTPPPMQKIEE